MPERTAWETQLNATISEYEGRIAALEGTVARLDAHSAEMAREMLDLIDRADSLERSMGAGRLPDSESVGAGLVALEERVYRLERRGQEG